MIDLRCRGFSAKQTDKNNSGKYTEVPLPHGSFLLAGSADCTLTGQLTGLATSAYRFILKSLISAVDLRSDG